MKKRIKHFFARLILNLYVFFVKMHLKIRKSRRPKILLYCASDTMIPHLIDYYNCFEKDKYNFYIYCPYENPSHSLVPSGIHIIRKKPYRYVYNLVVSPDLFLPFLFRALPSIYVNHGLHIVKGDYGEPLYAYADGNSNSYRQPTFSKILEPNSRIAKEIIKDYPVFNNHVVYSGFKYAEDIVNNAKKKDFYRKKLGIKSNQILVGVFSTWGKDSLFHQVGRDLISQATKLIKTGKYTFILSNHPKEYTSYSPDANGKQIDNEARNGFIIRDPKEDFSPFLSACDLIISDYSSMGEIAIIADKPLIFSSFDINRISRYSELYHLVQFFPSFKPGDNLEKKITAALNSNHTEFSGIHSNIYIKRADYEKCVRRITKELLGDK